MCEQLLNQGLMHPAASRPRSVLVERFSASTYARDDTIDRHVSGTAIKSQHLCQLSPCGENGHITDATDVVDNASAVRIPKQHVVHVWGKRRTLTAGGHVAGAKVRHRQDPGSLGNDAGFTEL
jgi:hypothetical protein